MGRFTPKEIDDYWATPRRKVPSYRGQLCNEIEAAQDIEGQKNITIEQRLRAAKDRTLAQDLL